tara:strand:- start:162 stop:368 length:207 start_codon:yes stop_codon:yes gene_type:complete
MYRIKRFYKGKLIRENKAPLYPDELIDLDEKDKYKAWNVTKDNKGRTIEATYTPTIWRITVENIDDEK